MREILFRGKTKEGNWVEGYFVRAGIDKYYIFQRPNFIPFDVIDTKFFTEVIPETVGQYTGLRDKNGKKIFEGDLIRICNNHNGVLEVEFKNQYVGGWVLTYNNQDLSLGARNQTDIEIIGNKY